MRGRRPTVNSGFCGVEDCKSPAYCRSFCKIHYRRLLATGNPVGLKRKGPKPKPKARCAVHGCAEIASFASFCGPHYRRARKHGDPLSGGTPQGAPARWIAANIQHDDDECLAWPFSDKPGYYSVKIRNGYSKAHREMCRAAHGDPERASMFALHSCGNKNCVNPRHLRWGTPAENIADAISHGTFRRGESSPMARLTEDMVRNIRLRFSAGEKLDDLALEFPVGRAAIWSAARGKTWAHI